MQRHFAQDVWRGARAAVNAACEAGVAEAKRGRFKDRTGALRGNIHSVIVRESDKDIEGEIRSPEKHSSYVEEGTGPHDIWPKVGSGTIGPMRQGQSRRSRKDVGTRRIALRWVDGAGIHFARMVHHPGSKSFPFMGPAYVKAEAVLTARMEAEIAKAAERLSQ